MQGLYTIGKERFEVISLAYNNFLNDLNDIKDGGKYAGQYSQERSLRGKEIEVIYDYIQGKEDKEITIIIDMNNIVFYPSRAFEKFMDLKENRIIFWRVADLSKKLKNDLSDYYLENIDSNGNILLFSNIFTKEEFFREIQSSLADIYINECAEIVSRITKNHDAEKPQESSGIYSNSYVHIKDLFTKPYDYNYIIFELLSLINSLNIQFDALVSTSRNGAVIANILGWLLEKKVVHCTSLGPKYAIEVNTVNKEIRKGKKYLYIFDFICLGTEIKVLNALLDIKEAELVGGVGIANYIDFDSPYAKRNVLGNMKGLVNIMNFEIPYFIAGTKEDLKILMEERANRGRTSKGV